LKVPFVDIISALLNRSLPLTVHEYEEWGNPYESSEILNYLMSYDPYLNIPDKSNAAYYPNILLTGSTLDTRVPFWMPLKYIARLRMKQPQRRHGNLKLKQFMEHLENVAKQKHQGEKLTPTDTNDGENRKSDASSMTASSANGNVQLQRFDHTRKEQSVFLLLMDDERGHLSNSRLSPEEYAFILASIEHSLAASDNQASELTDEQRIKK
jgi:hypothetical protein